MKLPLPKPLRLALLAGAITPVILHAQTIYLNKSFDNETLGGSATATASINATIVDGTSIFGAGSGHAVQLTDSGTSGTAVQKTAYLEYNFVSDAASEVGAIVYSFDFFNDGTYAGSTSSFIVGVGGYDSSSAATLIATASRAFNLEFSVTNNVLKLRGAETISTTYTFNAVNHFTVFVNDSETSAIFYSDPNNVTQTLAANSGAVYLGTTLLGTLGFSPTYSDLADDAGLGRLGFYSGSSVISQVAIDNITVSSISNIPEPSTYAAFAGLAGLAVAFASRRHRRQTTSK